MALVQLVLAARPEGWALLKDATPFGTYDSREDAMSVAARLSDDIRARGDECDLLVREEDSTWHEESCPGVH